MSTEQDSLAYKVAAHLRERILSGELPANTRLFEMDLAAEMGTSRAPVREALHYLEAEGLVINQGRRGTLVASFPLPEIEEIYILRALLEGYAAGHMARAARPEDLDALEAIAKEMDAASADKDNDRMTQLNVQFHRYIVEKSGHRRLTELWLQMNRQIRMIMLSVTQRYPSLDGMADYHRSIIKAIAAKDPTAAEATAKEHILSTGERLIESLQKGGVRFYL